MACASLDTLEKFKSAFLTHFEGTNEGDVTTYLGGELIPDSANRTITYRQSVYERKILQIYGSWDKPSVLTLLEAGARLTKADSPSYVDPALHRRYQGITGHLSFLVTMTQCNLEFAYAELSKFVQAPGEVHLKAVERVLQYLWGSFELRLTYSYPGPDRLNILMGWVDSDYDSDPDTSNSAEAEYVAASMAGQEVVYLQALLQGFGFEQCKPTVVWEDNSACIQIANNPVNRKFTRHIDVLCYFVRDLVLDDLMVLVKCAGTHNVTDTLTTRKSLPGPSFTTHCPFLTGTHLQYKVFFVRLGIAIPEVVAAAAA
eukprot:2676418-Rhodomonas_salina.1